MTADVINGGTMVAGAVIALFFFRYWQVTRDRLYVIFAASFLTFAASRAILSFLKGDDEGSVLVYGLRLLAFVLILAAIIDKNRTIPPPRPDASSNGNRAPQGVTRASTATRR